MVKIKTVVIILKILANFIVHRNFRNIKLREFWSVTVKMLFICYHANVMVSIMLGLLLALKKDLEFTKVI